MLKPRKMPGFFFSHNNMNELNGKEDCKLAKGKVHKKKQKACGADLKSYLKCMVPHIESGIKTSSSRNVMLSAEEVIQWSQSLEKLLASQSGQGVFREFLKSEFSEENIEFWLACEDYKKTKSDHLHGKAEKIYEEFVQSDAIKQINIDYQMREATAKKAQDPTHTSFDEAQKTVYILMERDSYPRFLKSKSYLNLLNQLQTNTSNL
ncbi:Regulator of G-protein signaling 1 [Lonchura striata]|uniref:Regulator of G-protein signaling 1 n=1 Tax=Lonchura striata TaxID=40157 RepID=A0A218V5B9_9PASE|nr:regulator of G-protein signaling 1 [Lonchura striata domestica]OWK60920.1 Regulator of G-protein signaling 1 [Lonchura striata domestica]